MNRRDTFIYIIDVSSMAFKHNGRLFSDSGNSIESINSERNQAIAISVDFHVLEKTCEWIVRIDRKIIVISVQRFKWTSSTYPKKKTAKP